MISIFFSHVCGNGAGKNCLFSNQLLEKLKKDFLSVYPYLSCKDTTWTNSTDLNDKVKASHFFIPVICDSFNSRDNCKGELAIARKQKQEAGIFPFVFPARYGCSDDALKEFGFNIDQTQETGERWESFVDSDFELGYENLRQRIHHKALEHNLITDEDFHKDIKVLDLLLSESNPTAFYVKTAVDACRKGEDYGFYFFKRLTHESWLSHLLASGFFNNNPAPIEVEAANQKGMFTIPFWPVLFYLEKISASKNRNIQNLIVEIMRRVSKPPKPNQRSDNDRTWYMFSKILANLPTYIIKLEDVDLIKYWLDSKFGAGLVGREIGQSLLPKLLSNDDKENMQKAVRVIDIIVQIKGETKGIMDAHDLEKLFEKNAVKLGEQCGKEVIEILKSRLESEQIIPEKDDAYSYIWRPAIEEHAQNTSREDAREALISGLRDVLLAYAQIKDASEALLELFKSSRWIVRRINLYVLNIQFLKYGELCQKLVVDNIGTFLSEGNYHHEFYELLRNRFNDFVHQTQIKIIDAIDNLVHDWPDDIPAEKKQSLDIGYRLRWFSAIKASGYTFSFDLVKKYDLDNLILEHPEFKSYHGSVTWGTEQLFSVGDLMDKGSVKDIIAFLNDFKGKNRFNEIGYEEAGQVLKQAIKAKQQFFENDLKEFLNGRFVYQYYAMQALEDLWKEKKSIDWQKVLDFFGAVIDSEELWEKKTEQRAIGYYFRREWIPSLIARLIESGVRDDERVMPDAYLPEVRKILEKLLDKIEPSAKGTDSDPLTAAINSPRGHAIEAYLNYALRECRVLSKQYENQGVEERKKFWEGIKPIFDNELSKTKNTNFEFSALAGRYLPNLYYLSKEWVEANINKILPVESEYEKNWRAAIAGYSYVNTVYTVIYRLLKNNNHLQRALETSFEKSNIRERIVENISISYLRGDEELQGENSLMAYILEKWQVQDMSSVIDLFWSHREVDFSNGEDQRILAFWEYCNNKIKGKEKENHVILSDLNLLTVFLKQIDPKTKEWLIQSAPYVEERHHSFFFLESLDKLARKSPKEVGEVYMAMLDGNVLPLYEELNIKSIVEEIYKAEEKSLANRICDRYSRAGFEFLNDLYEKYNH